MQPLHGKLCDHRQLLAPLGFFDQVTNKLFQTLGATVWLINKGNKRVSGTLERKIPELCDQAFRDCRAPGTKAGSGSNKPLGKRMTASPALSFSMILRIFPMRPTGSVSKKTRWRETSEHFEHGAFSSHHTAVVSRDTTKAPRLSAPPAWLATTNKGASRGTRSLPYEFLPVRKVIQCQFRGWTNISRCQGPVNAEQDFREFPAAF